MKRLALFLVAIFCSVANGSDVGNRLVYLNEYANPYYVGLKTARLTTPQWVGDEDVEAVIVLAIDDLGDPAKYEAYLRPILERLKQIDGRSPVSLMTKTVDPESAQIRSWLRQGLTVETHTAGHPCPCLQGGEFAKAKATFDQSVDEISLLPDYRPVAFRMPCCDSMNSVSPRFFTEIWNRTTPAGKFLSIDSSVFMLFTANDPTVPRELVVDADGREKFRKYIPVDRMMVNYVEDYCYPFVIDRLCWEFPALMPSDWDAQHLNGECSPETVRDMKAAIDAVVLKQGVFSLCFHPHGWIENKQVIELIEYAVSQHGGKVKFLTFGEANERLQQHLLNGHALRTEQGEDNGVRLCDVNNDGYMDVIVANASKQVTRIWIPSTSTWSEVPFPISLAQLKDTEGKTVADVQFGVVNRDGYASALVHRDDVQGMWHFAGDCWRKDANGLSGLECSGPVRTLIDGHDAGTRLRDIDLDGLCELVVSNPNQQAVFAWTGMEWQRKDHSLPVGLTIVDDQGRDAGLRFVDFDEDGYDDIVFSNAKRYAAYVFDASGGGWTRKMMDSLRQAGEGELPMIVRGDGSNNGAWFKNRHMWVQNEDTGKAMPNHVDHRSFTTDFLSREKVSVLR
jgi:hypothetical protein